MLPQVDSREAFLLPWKVLTEAARCFVQPTTAAAAAAASTPMRAPAGGAAAVGTPATRECQGMRVRPAYFPVLRVAVMLCCRLRTCTFK